jgi:hypothetical protein
LKEKLENMFFSVPEIDAGSLALETWKRLGPLKSNKLIS